MALISFSSSAGFLSLPDEKAPDPFHSPEGQFLSVPFVRNIGPSLFGKESFRGTFKCSGCHKWNSAASIGSRLFSDRFINKVSRCGKKHEATRGSSKDRLGLGSTFLRRCDHVKCAEVRRTVAVNLKHGGHQDQEENAEANSNGSDLRLTCMAEMEARDLDVADRNFRSGSSDGSRAEMCVTSRSSLLNDMDFSDERGKRGGWEEAVPEEERRQGDVGIENRGQKEKAVRVAVDVDEVLGSFLETLNVFVAEKYSTRHELSEFYVYDFMKIWQCSQAEANHRVHAFFESRHFNDGIPTIPGARETLLRLAGFCDLVVVTSRQHVIQEPTLEWLSTHYEGLFSEVHFGNHFALHGIAKPKSEMCKSLGAKILIDDNPNYAMECAENGINVLLFDWKLSYPWSKTKDGPTHPLIKRVQSWDEVELHVRAFIAL